MQQAETSTRSGASGRIELFEYPADPHAPPLHIWEGWGNEVAASEAPSAAADGVSGGSSLAEQEQRLAEETRKAFEGGRERGHQEGRQMEREAQAGAMAALEQRRASQAVELIESFRQERERYLHAVEHEVVKLALAVAARILRREAQMDPLLLTGAVRVALGQLSGSTQVRLRVPAGELDLWMEAIALVPNLPVKPVVEAGEGMRLGDCLIETELGSVDLGIRAQLGEIERGFFDRAGRVQTRCRRAGRRCPKTGEPLMTEMLARYFGRLERGQPWRWRGQVLESVGQTIESAGPLASVGECCEIQDQFGRTHLAEVIGFRGSNVLSMPVESTEGIRFGNRVEALGVHPEIEVGPALMGRVLNALGEPIDDGPQPASRWRCRWRGWCGGLWTGYRSARPWAPGFAFSTHC